MSPLSTPLQSRATIHTENGSLEAAARIRDGMRRIRRKNNSRRSQAIAFDHVGKLGVLKRQHLQDLRSAFANLLKRHRLPLVNASGFSPPTTVIGLSESGIVPSYAMATLLRSISRQTVSGRPTDSEPSTKIDWICSTRNPANCEGNAIEFQERHSHAPGHFLDDATIERTEGGEFWVVEDEITTGQTIINLIESLIPRLHFPTIRIFALVDLRSESHQESFSNQLSDLGIDQVDCRALISQHDSPDKFQLTAQTIDDEDISAEVMPTQIKYVCGEQIADVLPWVDQSDEHGVRQFTLSPWEVDDETVRNRIEVGQRYHLYNAATDEALMAHQLFQTCRQRDQR